MGIKLRKQIQKYGNALVIKISVEDKKIYNIKLNDLFDIELTKIDDKGGETNERKNPTAD
jgi:hypothetical protein